MSDKYKTKDTEKAYFVTLTVVGWIDLFTRKELKAIVVESLKYCQKNKRLILYGWCLMPSHLHLVCHTKDGIELSDILRDFKKFTSKNRPVYRRRN